MLTRFIFLVVTTGNFDRYLGDHEVIYASVSIAEALILFVFTMWMVVYVIKVKKEVSLNLKKDGSAGNSRGRSLWRINTVVAACLLAAALRLLALFLIIFVSKIDCRQLRCFVYSNWIPTIIPSIVLLFVTRPNPNAEEDAVDENEQYRDYSTDAASTVAASSHARFYSADGQSTAPNSLDNDPRASRFSSHIEQEGMSSDMVNTHYMHYDFTLIHYLRADIFNQSS